MSAFKPRFLKQIRHKFNISLISIRNYNNLTNDVQVVPKLTIKKALKLNNIHFEDGFTCFITSCILCKNPSKNTKLYINKTSGLFMCSGCKKTGQWGQLESYLNIKKSKKLKLEENTESELIKETLDEIHTTTNDLKDYKEEDLNNILKKFKLPIIPKSIFDNINVRVNNKHTSLYFPLENVDSEIVGFKKIHSTSHEDVVLPDLSCGGVLTSKATKNKDTAVLVPSISDFMILANAKINVNVVCLTNGVNNLPLYVLPSLERFKKLILWFGSDNKSLIATRKFAKKLEEKRCLFISSTNKQPHLDTSQDFKSIISSAKPIWHKSVTTFSTLRSDVASDLQNIDKEQGVKWKRYPTLNKILKGHRSGELTIFTGPTGSGKTTFMSDYSLDLSMQGVNTLWGSFEISNVRLAKTMLQQFAGFPFDETLHLFDQWADEFEKLPIYFMTFHGQQPIKVVMEAIEHATYIYDISHIIIDNLQFMMGTSEDQKHLDRFWKQDLIIASFREFATRKNCHVSLVIHPRKEKLDEDLTTSSIFGGAKASQEADNILILQDKRLSSIRGKKYLQIAKNRYSGDLGIMPLEFDKASLSFQLKKAKEKKIENPTTLPQPESNLSIPKV